jgi:hypothetical protein
MLGKLRRPPLACVLPHADSIPRRKPSEWGVVLDTNSAHAGWGERQFRHGRARLLCMRNAPALLAAACAIASAAQQQPAVTLAVHGTVTNAASGEPLPHALVLANGQNGAGVLTDGDGRFEIDGLSAGPNVFQISKPGFEDAVGDPASLPLRDLRGSSHVVYVTSATPELAFSLRPTNAIHGHVELSTGDPSQGISITLLESEIQEGRVVWRPRETSLVRADGTYRFAHLPDGDYAIIAEPASDTGDSTLPDASSNRISASGFPQMYYPDSSTFSGAARLHVAGGEQTQADLSPALRTFHLVRAHVILPAELRGEDNRTMIQVEVATADGTHAPYPAAYDRKTASIRAMLPDGLYTLSITAVRLIRSAGPSRQNALTGSATVTVAGHPITNLHIAVGAHVPNPLQIAVTRTSTRETPNSGQVYIFLTQAAPLTDGMQAQYAQGAGPGTLDTMAPTAGRYWVHTVLADPNLCEGSFTAGGASLGREPLVVDPGGTTLPLTLSLRDDCASLRVNLPPGAAQMMVGQETPYTVYVIPDFDFTTEGRSITVRATGGGSFQFTGLTPGSYHVYTFAAPVDLEYHNQKLLTSIHGQAITLDPGASADLTLEVPAP